MPPCPHSLDLPLHNHEDEGLLRFSVLIPLNVTIHKGMDLTTKKLLPNITINSGSVRIILEKVIKCLKKKIKSVCLIQFLFSFPLEAWVEGTFVDSIKSTFSLNLIVLSIKFNNHVESPRSRLAALS